MGGKSSSEQKTSQISQTTPYAAAQPGMDNLLGKLGGMDPNLTGAETSAFDSLTANAQAGNPFATQIGGVANSLLSGGPDRTGMVTDALTNYQNSLTPFANGSLDNNPELRRMLDLSADAATQRVGAMYAGSGRDPSGAGSYAQNVGKGVGEATAPILYDAYNQGINRRLGAANSLFGAATTGAGLLSGLDQAKLGNQQAGIGAASAAQQATDAPFIRMLELEAQKRGTTTGNIASLLGPLMQAGQAFGTTNASGTSSGTQQMSGAQQFAMLAQGLGSLFGGGQKTGQAYTYGA